MEASIGSIVMRCNNWELKMTCTCGRIWRMAPDWALSKDIEPTPWTCPNCHEVVRVLHLLRDSVEAEAVVPS